MQWAAPETLVIEESGVFGYTTRTVSPVQQRIWEHLPLGSLGLGVLVHQSRFRGD